MTSDSQNLPDRELVVRLIRDDERAFRALYTRYKRRLVFFAIRFIKDPVRAEDVFQDTFLLIWESRHFLDPDKSFSSYVFTIVKNRVLNILRNIEYDEELKRYILSRSLDYDDRTGRRVLLDDARTVIAKALAMLSPRQRQIFMMSRDENMSYKEIAQKLNLSVYTVQEHISLAIKRMKDYLSDASLDVADTILLLVLLNL